MLLCNLEMSDDGNPRDEHNGSKPGADVSFLCDRMTVEQFRARFKRARWSDSGKARWVPGKNSKGTITSIVLLRQRGNCNTTDRPRSRCKVASA